MINDWLIYIEPSNTGYDEYVMERYDMEHHKRIEHISGAQRKCSFVFDQSTNSVWLSNDWDGKPTFKIDGLSVECNLKKSKRHFSLEAINGFIRWKKKVMTQLIGSANS